MAQSPPLPPRTSSYIPPVESGSANKSLPPLPPRRQSVSVNSTPLPANTTSYGGFSTLQSSQPPAPSGPPKLPPRQPTTLSASNPFAPDTQSAPPPLPSRNTPSPPLLPQSYGIMGQEQSTISPSPRAAPALPNRAASPSLPPTVNKSTQTTNNSAPPSAYAQATATPPQQRVQSNSFSPQHAYGATPSAPPSSSTYPGAMSSTAPPPKLPSRSAIQPPPTSSLPSSSSPPIQALIAHPDVSLIQTSAKLKNILASAIKRLQCPGISIVVVKKGKIIDRGVLGIRKVGSDELVTSNDLWHIGSCTKSFVGTLGGKMVTEGKLKWTTSLGEVFPDLLGKMHPSYEKVTFIQLMQHKGGAPSSLSANISSRAWQLKGRSIAEQRWDFVQSTLSAAPEVTPGTQVLYSNSGTTIAAAMLERIAGSVWETMNTEQVCKPLGLLSTGYGVPSKNTSVVDQPWGHKRSTSGSGMLEPHSGDNPPAIGPSAYLHISADDFARYLIAHVEGHNGTAPYTKFMSKDAWRSLHTQAPGNNPLYYHHAVGWLATESMITHDGSNLSWWCRMWASTSGKDAFVICSNGEMATNDAAEAISSDIRKQLLGLSF